MVQTQLEQISNVQKDLLANNAKQDDLQAYGIKTRGGTHPGPSLSRGASKENRSRFSIAGRRDC